MKQGPPETVPWRPEIPLVDARVKASTSTIFRVSQLGLQRFDRFLKKF